MKRLRAKGASLLIYEPMLRNTPVIDGCEVVVHLSDFKSRSQLILANRFESELEDAAEKVYTRDLFQRD